MSLILGRIILNSLSGLVTPGPEAAAEHVAAESVEVLEKTVELRLI